MADAGQAGDVRSSCHSFTLPLLFVLIRTTNRLFLRGARRFSGPPPSLPRWRPDFALRVHCRSDLPPTELVSVEAMIVDYRVFCIRQVKNHSLHRGKLGGGGLRCEVLSAKSSHHRPEVGGVAVLFGSGRRPRWVIRGSPFPQPQSSPRTPRNASLSASSAVRRRLRGITIFRTATHLNDSRKDGPPEHGLQA